MTDRNLRAIAGSRAPDSHWPARGQAFHHPTERSIWLMSLGAVYRLRGDVAECIAKGPAVESLVEGTARRMFGFQSAFYFDPAQGTPSWFFTTFQYSTCPSGLVAARWTGERFERRSFEDERKVERGDLFGFDPRRGVLVHFVAAGADRSGVTVRECGADGRWRDVPGVWPTVDVSHEAAAGWHRGRGEILLVSAQRSWCWSGTDFADLGVAVGARPIAISSGPGGVDPLVFQEESARRIRCARLGPTGLVPVDVASLEAMADAVYDEAAEESVVVSPFTGPGRAQRPLAVFDPAYRLVARGREIAYVDRGAPGGGGVVWGPVPLVVRPPRAPYDERDAEPSIFRATPAIGLTELAAPGAATIGVVSHGEGLSSVRFDGTVDRFDGTRWSPIESAVRPPRRSGGMLGAKPDGTLLLVGGSVGSERPFGDAWSFDGQSWAELARKGKAPALRGGLVALHRASGSWVVAGGRTQRNQPNPETWECSEKAWTRFQNVGVGDGDWRPDLLEWDEPSGLLFAASRTGGVFSYLGGGVWQPIASLEGARGAAMTFLAATRTLVLADASSFQWFALGEALDDAAGAPVGPDRSLQPAAKPSASKPSAKATPAPAPAPPLAPLVHLLSTEDGADKFWRATLTGDSWTADWGKRGTKGTSKTYSFASSEAARADYEKKVRAKLAKGYEDGPPAIVAHRVGFAKTGPKAGEDHAGGTPPGVDAAAWPTCKNCGHPMQFLLLFGRHAERLPLEGHAALAVFACNGEHAGGACETWEPDGGCNRVLLLGSVDGPRLTAAPSSPDGKAPPTTIPARAIHYERQVEDEDDPDTLTKLGGCPAWVQGEELPACDECRATMRYVAQIDERLHTSVNFGGGRAFVFLCPAEHQAKLSWQQ